MPSPTNLASFRVNGVTIADVGSAVANLSRASIDTTSLGASNRTFEQGFIEGSIDIEVFFDASHDTVVNAFKNGTSLTAAEVVWASGMSVAGNAIVQNWNLTTAPNGVASATFSLIFAGSSITIDNT
jgi:hypothetical protein